MGILSLIIGAIIGHLISKQLHPKYAFEVIVYSLLPFAGTIILTIFVAIVSRNPYTAGANMVYVTIGGFGASAIMFIELLLKRNSSGKKAESIVKPTDNAKLKVEKVITSSENANAAGNQYQSHATITFDSNINKPSNTKTLTYLMEASWRLGLTVLIISFTAYIVVLCYNIIIMHNNYWRYYYGYESPDKNILTIIVSTIVLLLIVISIYILISTTKNTLYDAIRYRLITKCNPKKFMKPYNKDKVILAQKLRYDIKSQKDISTEDLIHIARIAEDNLGINPIGNFYIRQLKRKVHPKKYIKDEDWKFLLANELYSKLQNPAISFEEILEIDRRACELL